MPKKLRPAVDLMAFKCRTLNVKGIVSTCIPDFGGENLRERDHSEVPVVDGRIILRWMFKNLDERSGLD
jgi:hypothetical protein